MYIKQRLLALVMIILSIGMVYYGWHQLAAEGTYYPKMAAFSPAVGVAGLFLLFFPTMGGVPTNTKQRLIGLGVFAIGMVIGLINWFLMDPGFFGF